MNPAGGVLLVLGAVLLVESWRRGILDGFIGTLRTAARGEAKPRPFTLPTARDAFIGDFAVQP